MLRELCALEGRVLGRLADLDARLDQLEGGHKARGEDVRAMRDAVSQLREDLGRLTAAVLDAQRQDVHLAHAVGDLRAELVAAGAGAGGRRGALAGVGAGIVLVGLRWLAARLGLPVP